MVKLSKSRMSTLPLIRVRTGAPIVNAFDKLGLPTDELLDGVGLNRATFEDAEAFVSAIVLYQFFEDAAAAANNSCLLFSIGQAMDMAKWEPMLSASESAKTVGDFLTFFAIEATKHSSATRQNLEVHGDKAIVFGKRSFKPTFVPAQIDGFFVGLLLALLREMMHDKWQGNEVIVTVSDPKCLPKHFLGVQVIKGDRLGYKVMFPGLWLRQQFDRPVFLERLSNRAANPPPKRGIVDSVRQALEPLVGQSPISAEDAAEICGYAPRTLNRLLSAEGTSMRKELDHLKSQYAQKKLLETSQSVEEISAQLGYADATSFSRSFRRWTGKSPQKFRLANSETE